MTRGVSKTEFVFLDQICVLIRERVFSSSTFSVDSDLGTNTSTSHALLEAINSISEAPKRARRRELFFLDQFWALARE